MYIYIFTHIRIYLYVCVCMYIYVHMYIDIFIYTYIYICICIYIHIYIYILYVYNKHIFNIYITLLCIPIITQWLLDWILWLEILVVCVHNPPGYSTSFAMRDMGASNIYVMRSEVCGNFVCTYGWVGVGVCAYVSVRMDTPPTLL